MLKWRFIKQSGPGDRYKIMATATHSLHYPSYLTITALGDASQTRPPAPPTLVDDARALIWQIVKEKDNTYVLTTNGKAQFYGKIQHHEAFLTVSEAGMLDSIKKRASNCLVATPSKRWQIIEYWLSIPQDTNPNLNGLMVEALTGSAGHRQQENHLLLAYGPHLGPSFLANESENYSNKVPCNKDELCTETNTTFNQLEAVNHFLMNMPWLADPVMRLDFLFAEECKKVE
ncbi:hypothetical protein H0H92_008104 [Tricholoma furcatifolium]|nr:hypothetical protein H0H92_008104 [Tricholoma furcatifolium]